MARQRLRPWLLHTLDKEKIPGVDWIDREQQIFRIPWKHGSKQDWTAQDSKIFMEWAIHTGKHREGIDEPNHAQCKTRLRCALNKAPDIIERKDLENHDRPDPYKVYQFKDVNAEQLRQLTEADAEKEEMDMEVESPADQPIPTVVYDYSLKPADRTTEKLPSDLVGMSSGDLVRGGLNTEAISTYLSSSLPMANLPTVEPVQMYQNTAHAENVAVVSPMSVKQDISASPAVEPFVGDAVVVDGQFNDTHTIGDNAPPLQVRQVDNAEQLQTAVQCHYRSMFTLDHTVHNTEGFRIYYGDIPQDVSVEVFNDTFGPQNLEQVALAEPGQFMVTGQQRLYTQQILESFSRGVYFKFLNGDIYAKRLCKPSVFFKSNATNYTVQKLERNVNDMTKVFDFQGRFRTELARFMEGNDSKLAPSADIYLSVGQRPQKDDMSENLLIRVKITHLLAKFYLEQAVGTEFPSICISNADDGDMLAQFLKGIHIGDPATTVQT